MLKIFFNKTWFHNRYLFLLILLLLFCFRLFYGITSEFWFEDEQQIFLIGLKFFSTGNWPYFGPDVVYTQSQIPGALQGILVGGPFYVLPIPEAPYIFLNIITFASLFFLGYYIKKRLPEIPAWFLWPWIFTMPWVLNFSTHVLNPSYVLPFAILFFISFLEIIPVFRKGVVGKNTGFLLMGISLLAVYQLHMSWVLLIPFILLAFMSMWKQSYKQISFAVLFFMLGCLLSASLLIPTFIKYGFASGGGGTASNLVFNASNIKEIGTVIMRYFSFATFESTRFLGNSTVSRLSFLSEYLWAAPFIVFAALTGIAQVLWLIVSLFRKNIFDEWRSLKVLIIASTIMIWLSFFFSVKGPSSHTFYIMFPLMVIYSFYCWNSLFKKRWIRKFAMVFLLSGFVFNGCVAYNNLKTKSMYINRVRPLKAIEQKDFHILGERRAYDRNY